MRLNPLPFVAIVALWTVGSVGIIVAMIFGAIYIDIKVMPLMATPMIGMIWISLSLMKRAYK